MSETILKYIKKIKGPQGPYYCEEPYYVFKTTLAEILSYVNNPVEMYRIKREYFDRLPNDKGSVYKELFVEATEELNPIKVIIWRVLLWKYTV